MPTLRAFLKGASSFNRVVVPSEIGLVLDMLEFDANHNAQPAGASGEIWGTVRLSPGGQQSPIPGINLGLGLPADVAGDAPAVVRWTATGFKVWIVLSKGSKVYFAFKPIETAPGAVLLPARKTEGPDGLVTFVDDSANQKLQIVSRSGDPLDQLAPSLLVHGDTDTPAALRFTPDTSQEDGIVPFGVEPNTVLIKGTSIGLEFGVITFDDSETATAPEAGPVTLKITNDPSAAPAWRGIVCRDLKLYLPSSIPLFGGRAISMWFAAAFGGGIHAVADTVVPAVEAGPGVPERKGFSAHIECVDPTAQGFAGLLPTLISATMELPVKPNDLGGAGGAINFIGGKPVRARLTLSRDTVNTPGDMRTSLCFDAQGPNGLLSVRNSEADGLSPGHFFNVAAGLATSLIASGEAGDGTLGKLAAGGAAASPLFKPQSEFVLNAVELQSNGHGIPVGGELRFSLDYSVALRVKKIGFADGLGVEMVDNQPMRFRIRKVALVYGAGEAGGFDLDYQHADMEIENPGAWDIGPLKNLFDVIGGRSGRGSMWVEVDLRFKLNLGPVQVSGITLRATKDGGDIHVTATKMSASLSIPAVLSGSGEVRLVKDSGFAASLSASIIPLNITADALVIYAPPMTVLGLGVDLPAPIPLANSGLGLFGIGGLFGTNGAPKFNEVEPDPVQRQLQWKPDGVESFREEVGATALGLGAVIGTLPDMGTAFSAKASILVTVPDAMVRGSLNARAMTERVSMNVTTESPSPGYSAFGVFSVDPDAVDFAVVAKANFEPLMVVTVPMAGHFSRNSGSDWYIYLGADGAPQDGRNIGPVSVQVLPNIDVMNVGADAYLMMRGSGLTNWPYGRAVPSGPWSVADGFVVAFGFSVHNSFGAKPIAWATLNASLDLLLGTSPITIAGFGSAGGSLHLGPFSVGVQATMAYRKQEQLEYLWAEVVAKIELLFTDIEGRVTISHGDGKAKPTIPEPVGHPLDRLAQDNQVIGTTPALTDDSYRLLAYLSETHADAPVVWPDVIISVPFGVMPDVQSADITQFPAVAGAKLGPPKPVGTEMLHYTWFLNKVALRDVTDAPDKDADNAGVDAPGHFASSWQAERAGSTTVSELIINSHGNDLFARRIADGGKSLDSNPTEAEAHFCELAVAPREGWAIGARAVAAPSGTRVPAELISSVLTQSLIQATAITYAQSQQINIATNQARQLNLDGLAPIPSPYRVFRPGVQSWPQPQVVAFDGPASMKHEFEGHYWVPNLTYDKADPGAYAEQVVELRLDEEVRSGQLLLLVPDELPLEAFSRCVRGKHQAAGDLPWTPTIGPHSGMKSPAGEPVRFVLLQAQNANTYFDTVIVRRAVGQISAEVTRTQAIAVVGLRGITWVADLSAAGQNQLTKAKTAALAKNKTDQYDPDFEWVGPYARTILQPGRLYRLDIEMSWEGHVFEQDVHGARVEVLPSAGGTRNKRFFFRTAAKKKPVELPFKASLLPHWAAAAVSIDAPMQPADNAEVQAARFAASRTFLAHTRTDEFDAELVQRYFGGYTPAQSELYRFRKDPLQAHFTQDHVVALAQAYGFDLKLACRRVDEAGPSNDAPDLQTMKFGPLLDPSVLSEPQRIRYDAITQSPCEQPTPGTTGSCSPDLAPRAWYELYVHALQTVDGESLEAKRFRGVTFRTSRWTDPADMLKDVLTGTGSPGQPYMQGDLLVDAAKIDALRQSQALNDDRSFENAAAALGADGWPAAEEPRISWLWSASEPGQDDYRLAGVMIESPEPIVRPGRVDLMPDVDLSMGTKYSRAGALKLARSDRAGCRFLFLATSPIQIRTWEFVPSLLIGQSPKKKWIQPALVFRVNAAPEGDFTQTVPLATQPSFLEAGV